MIHPWREPLPAGVDLRQRTYRRAAFLRFYGFHLAYGTHPGCVYFLIPWLRKALDWSEEDALWFAFLNGNTQNPLTSLRLMEVAPTWEDYKRLGPFLDDHWAELHWDTDRRYQKKDLGDAAASYAASVLDHGGSQRAMFAATDYSWPALWFRATGFTSFGRLAAFSYLEYVRLVLGGFDCADLLLGDRSGSRSHRNGLCILLGHEELDWHASNPTFDGRYSPDTIAALEFEGARLLADARAFMVGRPGAEHVSYFTLESALCTYKSLHRPNRRYPNVYADMHYNRIKAYEDVPGMRALCSLMWQARADCLPPALRLEATPNDPGLVPVKQNWYREHGELPMLSHLYPEMRNGFDYRVAVGAFGARAD